MSAGDSHQPALSKVRTVHEYGDDTRLVEAKLGDEAEIYLPPH